MRRRQLRESLTVFARSLMTMMVAAIALWLFTLAVPVLLSGVNVGETTIVAAGAVVTKNCAPGAMHADIPARRLW
jgi:type IV secretory pathway TrbL component